jgi:hypothetical protein
MSNILIAYDNRIDEATLSGGSWVNSLPLSNVQDRVITKVARTTNRTTESMQFKISLPSVVPIRTVAFIRHNLTVSADMRITLSKNSDLSLPLNLPEWVRAYPSRPFILKSWNDPDFFCGEPRDTARSRFSRISYYLLPATVGARYILCEFRDPDTTKTGDYLQFGRVFIGKAWVPEINYAPGQRIWYENVTDRRRALGGTLYTDLRANFRVIQFALPWLTEDEALGFCLDMQKTIGDSDECIVNLEPSNTLFRNQLLLMGRVRTLAQIERSYRFEFPYSTTFEIEEIV